MKKKSYWLLKTEPEDWSWKQQVEMGVKGAEWNGVRNFQASNNLKEMRIDDDQDSIWLRVDVIGGASCHVGYRSCFYRSISVEDKNFKKIKLVFEEKEKVFDPKDVYGNASNPTKL